MSYTTEELLKDKNKGNYKMNTKNHKSQKRDFVEKKLINSHMCDKVANGNSREIDDSVNIEILEILEKYGPDLIELINKGKLNMQKNLTELSNDDSVLIPTCKPSSEPSESVRLLDKGAKPQPSKGKGKAGSKRNNNNNQKTDKASYSATSVSKPKNICNKLTNQQTKATPNPNISTDASMSKNGRRQKRSANCSGDVKTTSDSSSLAKSAMKVEEIPKAQKALLVQMREELNLPFIGNIMNRITQYRMDEAWTSMLRQDGVLVEAITGKKNKSGTKRKAPGIDGLSTLQAYKKYPAPSKRMYDSVHNGYTPSPVRRIIIPKVTGGERILGIPTVYDRVVQKTIKDLIEPIIDPYMSESSYGFRSGSSVYDAAKQVKQYISEGAKYAVSCDLSKYFDTVPHDKLNTLLSCMTEDSKFLQLMTDFLKSGVSIDGTIKPTTAGTPQGGVISPFLANLYLHILDTKLESKKLQFVRYADDFVIFANSKRAGNRLMNNVQSFVGKIDLIVNKEKSSVVPVKELNYLGLSFTNGCIGIADKSIKNFKGKCLGFCKRDSNKRVHKNMGKFKDYINGWFAHYSRIENYNDIQKLVDWFETMLYSRIKNFKGNSNTDPLASRGRKYWRDACNRNPKWAKALDACISKHRNKHK